MLDTCVIVAAIKSAGGASRKLVEMASTGEITAVLNESLANEYEDVIFRPEHRLPGWGDADLHALIDSILVPSDWAATYFSYRPMLADEADELVLEAAINGRADIVTFNKRHFTPAARFGIHVFTPGEILERLYERGIGHGTE